VDADLKDLVPVFLRNRAKDIEFILEALKRGNSEAIQRLAHSMKGAGGGYGFDAVTGMRESLEKAAKAKNPEEVQKWVSELVSYFKGIKIIYE